MKLYNVLFSANFKLVKSLFAPDVLGRAVPYINDTDIFNIMYDPVNDTCSALVFGTRRYSVSISLNQREKISVKCNCPAAKDFTPFCKHAAALLILIVEYFSGWNLVNKRAQAYYTTFLNKAFMEAVKQQNVLEASYNVPVLTKPAIVFMRAALTSHPRIVLVNGSDRTNKIARIIEKNLVRTYNHVLEKVFEKTELFDFFVYTEDGLVALQPEMDQAFKPVWQIKQLGDEVELSFVCNRNGINLASCVPLSDTHAIDFEHKKIVPLYAVDRHCYQSLNEAASALALGIHTSGEDKEQPAGEIVEKLRLSGAKSQIAAFQKIKISSEILQKYFAFPDKDFKTGSVHLLMLDRDERPVMLNQVPSEWRVRADEIPHLEDLAFTPLIHFAGKSLPFAWPSGYRDFADLLNTIFRENYEPLLPAIINFAQSFRDNSINRELRKKQFFEQIKNKTVPNQFFALMDHFWTQMSQYDSYKLVCREDSGEFDYFVFSKADLFIIITALMHFVIQHKEKFSVMQEAGLETSLSKKYIGVLAEYLKELGVSLYLGQKKVVQRNLSVEVDMQSDDDWFSISPSFYEKDVLLSETEWKGLLSATGILHESDTEVQVFDEKTAGILAALRTVKSDYQSKDKSKPESNYFEVPRLHIFTLLSLNKSGVKLKASPEDQAILKGLHNFTQIPSYEVPEKLQCSMRDYQKKGYDWLAFLYKHKFGACLADEMGLGKTVQTIAFLAGIHEGKIKSWDTERKRQHLIIAPASVIGNWEQEIKKFYPDFITTLYLGAQRTLNAEMFDIVLTTYDTVRSDINKFNKIPFHVAVFDEAQAVKNHKSQRAEATQQLQALFKLSLTGTPLENNVQEMCSIMNLTLPGLLTDDSAAMSLIKKGEYQAFHEKIAPFVLRRTKKEYLHDLPEKTEHDVYLPMTKKQKGLYGAIVDEVKQMVYKAYREKTKAQAGIVALTALLRLRQICVAPALVDEKQEKLSPKIEYLLAEIAKYTKEKTPLLVFSQFVGMLDFVMEFLQKNKIPYLRIDGTVPALQRKKIVEEFQTSNKIFVLLLSLKTGGVGLNLTRARVVIHLDPWWNPAVENQASDRVHRIGQQHDVKIIRLLMKDSIEEKMLVLKQKKKELFDAIMQGASGARGTALSKQDFDFLLTGK